MVSFAGDNVDELLITGDAELFESLEPSEVDQVKDTGHELVVFLGSFDSCHKEQSLDAVVTELSGEQAVLVAVAGTKLKMSLLCQFFVQLVEVDDLHVQLEKVTTEISTKFQEHVVVVDSPLQLDALKVKLHAA